ncbi:oligosaccharide flippase family protein [Photobacterium leiognathi]|uniref:oligosaccharide flippase family protein n=1 Tax=Photobacterium leiognathi TaxID=553611 RepID=UPI002981C257|nr:oligosaccharide flippase family protein [Photobacterium leiognathi]
MSGFNRLLKNSISNIINGFSNIILGIIISPFLLKILSLDDFSIWNLALQIGTFFSLIGYACQMTVARYITTARKKEDINLEKDVIRKGVILSIISIFFCLFIIFFCFINFSSFFHQIKPELFTTARYCVALISLSFVIGFFGSVFSGFFTGCERNDIPAIINLLSRILLGVVVIFIAKFGIVYMSIAFLTINILSYFSMYIFYMKNIHKSNSLDNKINEHVSIRKFAHYFMGMCGVNMSSFILIGMNGVLIGKYAFSEYSYYSLSMVLVTAAVGFISSALLPTMQPMIRFYDNETKINNLLYELTVFVSLFIFILLVLSIYVSPFFLKLWVGTTVADKTLMIFLSLLSVNLVRLIGLPISLFYFAKAKQNEIIYLPFIEAVISIAITIILVNKFSVYAVPISLFIAAVIIFIIYSFKLVYIVGEKYRFFYRVLFLIYPIVILGYMYLNVSYILNSYIGLIIVIPLFLLLLRKIKSIKNILGS